MRTVYDEQLYPLSYRAEEAALLGHHLSLRNSVELVGMKRVGISNFLRFFLYHKDIIPTYINPKEGKHLFIPVDLNDLIERELFPFWRLTLKRIVDVVDQQPDNAELKAEINNLLMKSIQNQDVFMTVDAVRQSLTLLSQNGIVPTLFFIRFDRLQDVVTSELFANLQGMVDATNQKLAYVFTGYRELHDLSPEVFQKASLLTFSQKMYLKPANKNEMEIIFHTFQKKYNLPLDDKTLNAVLEYSGGNVQYLQLSLIILKEVNCNIDELMKDERINIQSEELYAALHQTEQHVLTKVVQGEPVSESEKKAAHYLWDTGYIVTNGSTHIFSPYLLHYLKDENMVKPKAKSTFGLTKKEQLLFDVLKKRENQICERDEIVQFVWPECNKIGVSDWAIDRLVARLRGKLKTEYGSILEIQTIKTRGYKLINRETIDR